MSADEHADDVFRLAFDDLEPGERRTIFARVQARDDIEVRPTPDPGWGELYSGADDPYRTPDGPVWMFRKGQRVRFYDADGNQVGLEQANVAPAIAYAHAQRWANSLSDALGITTPPQVTIEKQGSLPSCVAWYVRGAPERSPRFYTRREAHAWCDAHNYEWRTK